MFHDFLADEDQDKLDQILIVLSTAIERVFEYVSQQEGQEFKNPETMGLVCLQVLAQLLANHIDLYPADQQDAIRAFVQEQQDLVYTLRAEHYSHVDPEEEPSEDDPYGLRHMTPEGNA